MRVILAALVTGGLACAQSTISFQNPSSGVGGTLQTFMSTTFGFDQGYTFFTADTAKQLGQLSAVSSTHMRMLMSYSPWLSSGAWDFSVFNADVPYLTQVGDRDPILSFKAWPSWISASDLPTIKDFYASVVRYANKGGGNGLPTPPAGTHVKWWSPYNEPNNVMGGADYANLLNAVAPAMRSVDRTIQIVAGELSWPDPTFISDFLANIATPVDAFAFHHYPIGCSNIGASESFLMQDFTSYLRDYVNPAIAQLQGSRWTQNKPILLTESNLSDVYNVPNVTLGYDVTSCPDNPTRFVVDTRAGTIFFVAWRAHLFAEIARQKPLNPMYPKATIQSLHHFAYWAGPQFGEVSNSGVPTWEYVVDSYIANYFQPGATFLDVSPLTTLDALATSNADGSISILVTNYNTAPSGSGALNATVAVDLSAFTGFNSATLVVLDEQSTDPTNPPVPTGFALPQTTITFNGYGAAFIRLSNVYSKLLQTITFAPLSNVPYGTSSIAVSAAATSGLPVGFTSNTTAVCMVSGSTVMIVSAGGCSITASQNGNATFAAAPPVTQSFAVSFLDVQPTDYYFNAINLLAQRGITAGCGSNNFCPQQAITRYQMAIFITRAVMGGDNFTYSSTPYFNDVPAGAPGFQWIQKMYELNITAGCGNGNYCPNDNVTRDQIAVFLIRARYGGLANFSYPSRQIFSDVPAFESYFRWIQRLAQDGIAAGCGNNQYCPGSFVIRGDMAILLMRGSFNQLLPANTPVITQISPGTLAPGASALFTITGSNTHFVQDITQLASIPGVTIGAITVTSATSLAVQLTAAANAVNNPSSIVAISGSEEAVLPNGLRVQ